jgi:hypothetical protein
MVDQVMSPRRSATKRTTYHPVLHFQALGKVEAGTTPQLLKRDFL